MAGPETCAACGSPDLRAHFSVAGGAGEQGLIPTTDSFGTALADIVRCKTCGHMQTSPMPADAVLESAYEDAASEDYVSEAPGQRETARRVLDVIERQGAGRRLLDLGCWVGFLLDEAGERGWSAKGVEPSRFASEFARDELGLDVITDDLFTAPLGAGAFDAVVLGDVIEHLPRPAEALERIATLLAAEGVIAMMLPDAGSRLARLMGKRWWSVIPTHVQFFTRKSMRTLLEREGWTVLYIGTQPKIFTVRYYLGRIGGYAPPVANALIKLAELVHIADKLWGPDFRDRMLVVARRPG